jgi:MYXO-CTERM domain-containing protein
MEGASKGTTVRKSVRAIIAGGIAAAAVLAAAAPAAAKCGHGVPCPDPFRLRVVVDGPGLAAPIVIRGKDAWTMVNVTGVNYRPYNVHDGAPANKGPRYEAVYEFRSEDRLLFLHQDIYPYATGRTFAFTAAGQRIVDRYGDVDQSGDVFFGVMEAGHGWRGSRTLGEILREHSFPQTIPAAASRGTRTVAASVGGGSPPWWIGGVLLLGAVAAVSALRRRSD